MSMAAAHHRDPATEIASLRSQNDDLAQRLDEALEQITQLRQQLLSDDPIPRCLGLTGMQEHILRLFLARDVVRRETWVVALTGTRLYATTVPEPKTFDVHLSHLRPKLKRFGIKIDTLFAVGYRMPRESKEIIRRLMAEENGGKADAQIIPPRIPEGGLNNFPQPKENIR